MYFVNKIHSPSFGTDSSYIYHWAINVSFLVAGVYMDVKWFYVDNYPARILCKASTLLVMMIIAYLKFILFQFCVPEFRLKASFVGMNIAHGMC